MIMRKPLLLHHPTANSFIWLWLTPVCCPQALEDAFLAIDGKLITEDVIKELVQIAGRPTKELPTEKVAEEDDCENIKMFAYFLILVLFSVL